MNPPDTQPEDNDFKMRRFGRAIMRGDRDTAQTIIGKEYADQVDWLLITLDTLTKLERSLRTKRIAALAAAIYGDPATSLEPTARPGQVGPILTETVRVLVSYGENNRVRRIAERVARTPWQDTRATTVLTGRIEDVYGIASAGRLRHEYTPENHAIRLHRLTADELADKPDTAAVNTVTKDRSPQRDVYAMYALTATAAEAETNKVGCKVNVHETTHLTFVVEAVGMLARAAVKERSRAGETGLEAIIEAANIGLCETYEAARLRTVTTTGLPAIRGNDVVRLDNTRVGLVVVHPMLCSFISNTGRFMEITHAEIVEMTITVGLARLNARRATGRNGKRR